MRLVKANQATAARRRVYFHLVDVTDGLAAETGEGSGQPQISTNGGAWTNTGIGTLTAIGNGRYYADLTQAAVATAGDVIETRYKSAATAECPGDSVQVVAFDPDDSDDLGLTAITGHTPQTGDTFALANGSEGFAAIDTVVDAILVDTGTTIPATLSGLSTHAAADVWTSGTRTLTASTNFNDPTAAAIADAVWDEAATGHTDAGKAGAQLWTDIDEILTDTGTTLPGSLATASALATVDTVVAGIKAVTDLLPDSGALSSLATAAALTTVDTEVGQILEDTGTTIPSTLSGLSTLTQAEVATEISDALTTDTIADSYASDGSQPTFAQAVLGILQFLTERAVNDTTVTIKKPDGSTTAMTLTLDDGTTPTSITRAT